LLKSKSNLEKKMVKKALICMAMLSLALFGCSKKTTTNNYYAYPDGEASIVGMVYPPESHAMVTAYMGIPVTSTYIDTNGYFKLSGLSAGTYSLLVQAEGYDDYSAHVTVASNSATVVDTIYLFSIHDLISAVWPYDHAQEVRVDDQIRISFRREMDRQSVEKAFQIEPEVDGEFLWYGGKYDGSTQLTFRPSAWFATSTHYQITVDTIASDTSGIKLLQPYHFSFTTVSVGVQYSYPGKGNTWVPPSTPISITFNSDMNMESVNSAFKMVDSESNEVTGDFVWYDRRNLSFRPNSCLFAKETFTVTIDTTASDIKGVKLPTPFQFSFTTQPVLISYTYPNNKETWVDTLTVVAILFNTDMDMESVDSAFQMVDSKLKDIAGKFVWHYPSQLEFEPDSSLTANETYTVTIDSTAKDMHGAKLDNPYSFWFKTRAY
jgi:hypothetical protein